MGFNYYLLLSVLWQAFFFECSSPAESEINSDNQSKLRTNLKNLDVIGDGPDLENPIFVKKNTQTPVSLKVFENYKSGQKKAIGSLKNGKHQGSWFYWYESGEKKCDINFLNGNRHGLWIFWHKNGERKYIGKYSNGKMDGHWIYWHENGNKRFEGSFKEGKMSNGKYWNSKGETVNSLKEAK